MSSVETRVDQRLITCGHGRVRVTEAFRAAVTPSLFQGGTKVRGVPSRHASNGPDLSSDVRPVSSSRPQIAGLFSACFGKWVETNPKGKGRGAWICTRGAVDSVPARTPNGMHT